jgi:sulfur carrier protein
MSTTTLEVRLNGEPRSVAAGRTVAALVEELVGPGAPEGVAVAMNGEVLKRADWSGRAVEQGDVIEIVRAIQGG